MVDRIIAARQGQKGSQALTRLRKARAKSHFSQPRAVMSGEWLRTFLAVPSMEILEGENIQTLYPPEQLCTDALRTSIITSGFMKGCIISANVFSTVFSKLRNLQTFEYTLVPCLTYHNPRNDSQRLGSEDGQKPQLVVNALYSSPPGTPFGPSKLAFGATLAQHHSNLCTVSLLSNQSQ